MLENLTEEQIDLVLDSVKSLQPHESKGECEPEIGRCPRCGSASFVKNGKDAKGRQRYLCKECGHTFSRATDAFLSHSKASGRKWSEFIDYEITGMPLKEESHYLGLSAHSCFRMRHKLYRAASEIAEASTKLGGTMQPDASYRKINLKGTKPWNMPRPGKKRGGGAAYSGISRRKVCIIGAVDSRDNMFLKIAGLGVESKEKYLQCTDYMDGVEAIVSDSKACISHVANVLEAGHDKIIPPPDPMLKNYVSPLGNALGDVNELDSGISKIIARTHGVSTRYLQSYLDFYCYVKQMRYKIGRSRLCEAVFDSVKRKKPHSEKWLAAMELPISLKEAYYEYRYGIFA